MKDQAVAFCGYLIDPDSLIAFNSAFNTKEVKFHTDLFGNVCLLGSEVATENLRERLQSIESLIELRSEEGLKPTLVEIAVSFALQTSGVFLEYEMRSPQSLLNYFGGGYEVASLGQRGFFKLDDVTYIFWIADTNGEQVSVRPHKAFKYQYYSDMLAIRTLSFQAGKTALWAFEDSAHVIEPIYRDITEGETSRFAFPDMNSRFLCNYFLVRDSHQRIDLFTKIDMIKNKQPNVIFTEVEGGLRLDLKDTFLRNVNEAILKRMKEGSFGREYH